MTPGNRGDREWKKTSERPAKAAAKKKWQAKNPT